MSIWRRVYGRERASEHTLAIFDEIENKLAAYGDTRPFVASIRIGAGFRDLYDFETEVELAPGATVAVRYGSVDEEDMPDSLEDRDRGGVALVVVGVVEDFRPFGFDALADLLHDLRMRTRKTLVEWSAEGINVELFDIRFARDSYWSGEDPLLVELRLRSLDYITLQPTICTLDVELPNELESKLNSWRRDVEVLFAMKAELARQGADGTVDQLVLNAIAMHCDVASVLRDFPARQFTVPSELTLFMNSGHVQCHGYDRSNENFKWNRNSLTIFGQGAPTTALLTLSGRPITDLVVHPVLSDSMIITDVVSKHEFGVPVVHAEFEQPRWLFCRASGRVWDFEVERR